MKKKEQYSSFLLNAPISFAILSPDYTFLEVNSSLRKKLGNYAAKYYQGKTVESVFGKKCAQTMHTYIQRAFNGETIQNVSPLKYAPKNKGEYYFSLSYVPITLKRTVESVGIIFRDITEQKSAEEGLEKYKVRLEQAQKAGKLGVFEWDIKTNKIWWSDEEESLFGAYPGKFKGVFKDWIQSVYKPDKERLLTEIAHSLKTGTSLDQEFRIKYPGNIIRWLKVKAQVYKANGAATRMIGIHHDITGRKQHEDLLAFKAEASRVLSSTLDYKETLSKMSQLAVTHIADWCAVDMVDDLTNEIVLVSVAHRNTAKAKWARKLRKKYPVDMNANEGLPIVLKTGQSLLVPHLSRTQLEKNIKTDEEKAILKKIGGVHSFMIVPINIGSKTIGAITFISSESKRQYTKQDIEMAEQLASRASMAIENTRLYEAVKAERERLDDLLDNVPAVVWEAWGDPTSKEQNITYISSYAESLLGYSRSDWITKPNFWRDILHPDDQEIASLVAKENYEKKDHGVSRFRWIDKDQKPIWVESQSFVIKDEKGEPIGMRGVVLDISERMREIKEKDDFIGLASHEIKTPLTTIKAYTQLLKSLNSETVAGEYLDKMNVQIEKLTRLVSELLDVSKIREGKLELHKQKFQFDDFLRDTISDLSTIYKSHSIQLTTSTPVEVIADKDRLSQVIENLITNAVKYSPESNTIRVTSRMEGKHTVAVDVQDFGIGINKRHQSQIFTRFYRVDGSSTPGLGIGLYISKEIMNRHGGDLKLQSAKNKGSTFTMTLPI